MRFLEQFHERFNTLVSKHIVGKKHRLVMFIDDLDRCLPEKAVEVLEAIKLFLDVPGCVFVLGLDQDVVSRGVEIKYREFGLTGEREGAGGEKRPFPIDGTRYLEKIFQLPFQIPPIQPDDVGDFVQGLVDQWPSKECHRVFAKGLGKNPRQVKRTVNVFLLLWHLAKKRKISEIKAARLAKVVAIQHIYPELYRVLRETPRLLRDLEKYYRTESASRMEGDEQTESRKVEPPPTLSRYVHRAAVRSILTLHPEKMEDVNFTGLPPGELDLYFTLTRRAEAPQADGEGAFAFGFEPQTVGIPAGPFLMGSTDDDKLARDNEKPRHTVELPEYFIGKYPVTNAEYRAFVQEAKYDPPPDWEGNKYSENKGGHPVVNVSWRNAVAYCDWLSKKTRKTYRLPSEAEWEKGARGADGWIYPWGNKWDKGHLNSQEGGPGDTTPVGQYSPDGDSPYGVSDMAGNVWEWTRSLWGKSPENPDFKYPYAPDSDREDVAAGDNILRVLRGGAFPILTGSCVVPFAAGTFPFSGAATLVFGSCCPHFSLNPDSSGL